MQDTSFTSQFCHRKLIKNNSEIVRKEFQDLKDDGYKEYSIDEYLNLIDGYSIKEIDQHIFEDLKKHENIEHKILVRNLFTEYPVMFHFRKEN